jgi:hypothetical protein
VNSTLTFIALLLAAIIILAVPEMVRPYAASYGQVTVSDCAKAVLLCSALATVAGWLVYRNDYGGFLLKLFLAGLLLRMLIGTAIFVVNGQEFFGGDAITYDYIGSAQLAAWGGDKYAANEVMMFVGKGEGSGWGMIYLVAAIYGLVGRNMLAVQLVNAVIGAVTAIIIFLCAQEVFANVRVARLAAFAVAFYPSLVLWSSQGLKDGPIVFLLALTILATLRLGQKFSAKWVMVIIGSLFCLLSLRFYVFYMMAVAVGGAFLIGTRAITAQGFLRQFIVIIVLGLGLTYLGVTRYANLQFGTYGSWEMVQRSRQDASHSAQSGFSKDVDVSTTSGALTTIPIGLLYLLFAPFPWQLASLRQSITLPEMIVWWASFPMLILGLWFSIRYRLRQISPILMFSVMLSLAYSVFQGNVGTAYRQRAQVLVFYFIFVAVGYVLLLEKREDRKRKAELDRTGPTIATARVLPRQTFDKSRPGADVMLDG